MHMLHTSFHKPGIIWVDNWNHSTCMSVSRVLWSIFVVASCFALVLCFFFLLIFCQSPLFFMFSRIADCAFSASTFLAHTRTCSLSALSFSSIFELFIISILMSLSFSPCINCSFNCLSLSLWLHSVMSILSLPFHSSALSFAFQLS